MKSIITVTGSIVLILTSLLHTPVLAHSEAHPVRYVSQDGTDQGKCISKDNPCASIEYAVNQSIKGDKIHISEGIYQSGEMVIFYLLNEMIEITGGYSKDFSNRNPEVHVTSMAGIPSDYRNQIAEKGIKVIPDTKGTVAHAKKPEYLKLLDRYRKITTTIEKQQNCANGNAGEYECFKIDLLSHVPLLEMSAQPRTASDIWGYIDLNTNKEYAVLGLYKGVAVFDVTDPTNPIEMGYLDWVGSTWRDLKVYQYFDQAESKYKAYAYVTNESRGGLHIIDLNDLPNGITLAGTVNVFETAHNVYLANIDYSTGLALDGLDAYLYVAGSNKHGGYKVLDLVDPVAPQLVSSPDAGYIHDGTNLVITDERTAQCSNGHNPCELFIDFNERSVDIWDTTDKANPIMLSETSYSGGAYTHSGWPSKDKRYVFVQDEKDETSFGVNTTLHVMDIQDLTAPRVVSTWVGTTRAIDHNGFTLGDKYYMSNYKRGLTVLDVSNPVQPKEIGFFDTYPIPEANDSLTDGAWGAYPYLPSGNILVSDISNGLFVLKDNSQIGGEQPPSPEPEPEPEPEPDSGSGGGGSTSLWLLLGLTLFGIRRKLMSN